MQAANSPLKKGILKINRRRKRQAPPVLLARPRDRPSLLKPQRMMHWIVPKGHPGISDSIREMLTTSCRIPREAAGLMASLQSRSVNEHCYYDRRPTSQTHIKFSSEPEIGPSRPSKTYNDTMFIPHLTCEMEQWAAAFNFIKAGRLSELLLHNTTRARNMELICTWKAFPTHIWK